MSLLSQMDVQDVTEHLPLVRILWNTVDKENSLFSSESTSERKIVV